MNNEKLDYKLSDYNYLMEVNGEKFIFNYLSGGFAKLKSENYDLINRQSQLEHKYIDVEEIDKEVLEKMLEGRIIINSDIEETNLLKAVHYKSRYGNSNSYGVTIAPTLACNFRCTYCFEKDMNYPVVTMTDEIIRETVSYIENKMPQNGNFNVNWFGGEPLVAIDVLEKIQNEINALAVKKNTKVMVSMITNGYLLTKTNIEKLIQLGIRNVQVTLDGDRDTHNLRRPLVNGKGTFDTILNNVIQADEKMRIVLRINVDKDNICEMDNFLNFLASNGVHKKENISIYFSLVRDYENNTCSSVSNTCLTVKDFAQEEVDLYKLLIGKGFKMNKRIRPTIVNCGAISPNSILIEPNGGLQKCWNCIGDDSKRVGNVNNNISNDLYESNMIKWLSWSPFDDKECGNCDILPACMNGCPYYSIYHKENKFIYNCSSLKYNTGKMLELTLDYLKTRSEASSCKKSG